MSNELGYKITLDFNQPQSHKGVWEVYYFLIFYLDYAPQRSDWVPQTLDWIATVHWTLPNAGDKTTLWF